MPNQKEIEFEQLLREIQREALAQGQAALRLGRRVIYIHGRPYADPGDVGPN